MTHKDTTTWDFAHLHILVIGDIMIDRYIHGQTNRISPEAPVPVVTVTRSEDRLGGAANVCANLKALGAQVSLVSISGDDDAADNAERLLKDLGLTNLSMIHKCKDRPTTIKTRVMAQNQHLLRLDQESTHDISLYETTMIVNRCIEIIHSGNLDGIIFQDYNKGLLSQSLISSIIKAANVADVPTFVDPKFDHFFDYKGCTFFKPNKKELTTALGQHDISSIHQLLTDRLDHKVSFVTLGREGIYFDDGECRGLALTSERSIADVCGAGDTVIATACLLYCQGLAIDEIARIANIAGGQVCEVPGVAIIEKSKLVAEST